MPRRASSHLRSAGYAIFGRRWVLGLSLLAAAFVVPRVLFGTAILGFPTRAPTPGEVLASLALGLALGALAPTVFMAAVLAWIAGAGSLQRTEVLGALWGTALAAAVARWLALGPRRVVLRAPAGRTVIACLAYLAL